MAYRIKNVQYQDEDRTILLQNENGPCPLLAVANALLLRGVITLPPSCIRSNIVSIEELVTIFADRALQRNDLNQQKTNTGHSKEEEEAILLRNKQSQYQVEELMQILPNLQFGMDINPKFMLGPEGYEFTKNLTAFDIMGVDLVHGWLLDPKDDTAAVIGNKTYNELIEIVVKGNDTEEETKKLKVLIDKKQVELSAGTKESDEENDWVNVSSDAKHDSDENDIQSEISNIKEKYEKLEELAKDGHVVDIFLKETGHQLTRYGLEKLHDHVNEGDLCVFFRNNHFSTMTKYEAQLFLLVTDLGYANVNDVVWEKLDAIDGNTDYYNSFFFKPEPRDDFVLDSGSTLTPEQLVAQRDQSEIDYQLALSLSNANGNEPRVSEDGIKPMAGINEMNLHEAGSIVSNQTSTIEDQDRQYALSLQTQFRDQEASERLAQMLREEERRKQRQHYGQTAGANTRRPNPPKPQSGCIVS